MKHYRRGIAAIALLAGILLIAGSGVWAKGGSVTETMKAISEEKLIKLVTLHKGGWLANFPRKGQDEEAYDGYEKVLVAMSKKVANFVVDKINEE